MGDKPKNLGGCKELAERFNLYRDCCNSCHEDQDMDGYSMIEIETAEGVYEVCCRMTNAYESRLTGGVK